MPDHGVSGVSKFIYMMNQYCLNDQGLALKMNQDREVGFNQCVTKCCSGCNTLQIFFLHFNFGAYYGSYGRSFLSRLLIIL